MGRACTENRREKGQTVYGIIEHIHFNGTEYNVEYRVQRTGRRDLFVYGLEVQGLEEKYI